MSSSWPSTCPKTFPSIGSSTTSRLASKYGETSAHLTCAYHLALQLTMACLGPAWPAAPCSSLDDAHQSLPPSPRTHTRTSALHTHTPYPPACWHPCCVHAACKAHPPAICEHAPFSGTIHMTTHSAQPTPHRATPPPAPQGVRHAAPPPVSHRLRDRRHATQRPARLQRWARHPRAAPAAPGQWQAQRRRRSLRW